MVRLLGSPCPSLSSCLGALVERWDHDYDYLHQIPAQSRAPVLPAIRLTSDLLARFHAFGFMPYPLIGSLKRTRGVVLETLQAKPGLRQSRLAEQQFVILPMNDKGRA